jgi:hypothetical protein
MLEAREFNMFNSVKASRLAYKFGWRQNQSVYSFIPFKKL